MATTSRDRDEPPETECSVCQNSFVDPKILPCGHLFCRDCVVSLIDKRNKPECPLCRHIFVDPAEKASGSSVDIANTLPTDFAMGALAKSFDLLDKEPVCCVCDGVKAKSLCVQCQDMLCSKCTTAHQKLSGTHSHKVECLSTATPKSLAVSRLALCADHGEKQSFFCSNHGLAVCASCAFANHRTCPEVKDLDSEMKSADEAMKGLTDTLTDAEKKMKQTINKIYVSLKEAAICKKLDTVCDNLFKICDKQKEASRNSLGATKPLNDALGNLRSRLAIVKSHKRIVLRARTVSPRPELIYSKRALQQRVHTMDLTATSPAEVNSISLPLMAQHGELIRQMRRELRQLEQQMETPKKQQLTFHRNRGDGVMLSENGKLATRIGPGGVVVSCEPLEPNVLYRIVVLETDRDWHPSDIQFCGVTGTHPNDLNVKPSIVEMEEVSRYLPESSTGSTSDVKKLSALSLMIDSVNSLQLYVETHRVTKTVETVPRPWYAVFDLDINVRKIRTMPDVSLGKK